MFWVVFIIFVLFNFNSQCYGGRVTNKNINSDREVITPVTNNLNVVGENDIDIKRVPYHASVAYKGEYYCGAVIIRNDVLLTAAQCVMGYKPEFMTIRAGSNYNYTGGVVVQVANVLHYPGYDYSKKNGDIGILWLSQSLEFSDVINKIEMAPTGFEVNPGSMAFVSGFGYITLRGPFAKHLYGVSVPVVSSEECNESYPNKITSTMMCAGFKAGGKDVCTYDSGGPLTYNGTLVGIVSWGRGCGRPNNPGVYTKVAAISSWVNSHI